MPGAHSQLLEHVLSRLTGVRREGNHHKACCPAHADGSPSLSVRLGDRGVLLRCYAGCTHQEVIAALGLRVEELFYDYDPERKAERPTEQADPTHELGLTRAAFAAHKGLDEAQLEALGVRDGLSGGKRAVTFSYPLRDGSFARVRIRTALTGKDRFRWEQSDVPVAAYEPDLGQLARAQRTLILVEGESDTLTLLLSGFPALGLPGADMAKLLTAAHLEGIERVFVCREPDKGGDTFARNVPLALERLGYAGSMHTVRMLEGAKDPSALFARDPAGFGAAFQAMLEAAAPPRSQALADLFEAQEEDQAVLYSGFLQLDEGCDDKGIPLAKLLVLVGGPGSKKTGCAVHFADVFSQQGAAVLVVCADEGRKNLVTRCGQRMGFNKHGLRDRHAIGKATRAEAARRERASGRVLRFCELDDEADAQTIEDAHAELLTVAKGAPRVLIVDSLQTCRSEAAEALERPDQRAQVDAKMRALRGFRRSGTLVIVVSETRRSFYGGDKPVTREDVLSAAKESGGVEFGADMIAGLVRDRVDEDLLELVVAKSRFGREPRFRLRWDRDRAELLELAAEDAETVQNARQREQEAPKAEQKRGAMRDSVLKRITRHPGQTRAEVRAALARSRATVYEAIEELLSQGLIREQPPTGKSHRAELYASAAVPPEDHPPSPPLADSDSSPCD